MTDVKIQLKRTVFIMPNNFIISNIAKKPFPGTPLGLVRVLGGRGGWTSPRWLWIFFCYPGMISGPKAFG